MSGYQLSRIFLLLPYVADEKGGTEMKKIYMVSGLAAILVFISLPLGAKEVRGPMKPIAPLMIEHRLIGHALSGECWQAQERRIET